MTVRSLRPTLLAFALFAFPVAAQDVMPDSTVAPERGTLVVETNLPEGDVYADGVLLGPAEEGAFELAPGAYTLTLREADPEAWHRRSATAEVVVRAGASETVRLDVPTRYRIESFPHGATVTLEQEGGAVVLGTTPLDHVADTPLDGVLVIAKSGYTMVRQEPGIGADNRYSLVLRPVMVDEGEPGEVVLAKRRAPNKWIDVAAVGLALGAGATAIYFKQKGDDAYDVYAKSGDPALRSDFERFDTYSAVALGAMQVGVGVFAIRLVLR